MNLTEEQKIEMINAAMAEFVGPEGQGTPIYCEPDLEKNYQNAVKAAQFIMDQPEYKGFALEICPSIFAMRKAFYEREGKSLDDTFVFGRNAYEHAYHFTKNLKDIGEGFDGIDDHIETLSWLRGLQFAAAGQNTIYVCQQQTRHFCELRDGNRVVAHNPNGFCNEWPDGTGLVFIDDVFCPEWIIKKTKEEVTAQDIMGIADTDVRKIAIKKFGLDAVLAAAPILEDDGEYQLIDLADVLNLGKAKYLRMVNPSTQETLALGISNECKSIQDALNWRSSGAGEIVWNPCLIDALIRPNGEMMQRQQGDVNILGISEEEFNKAIAGLQKIEGRDFVLSPINQKRHKLSGKGFEIYGNDVIQYIKNGVSVQHPEHAEVELFEYSKVWGTLEYDHIENLTRVEID